MSDTVLQFFGENKPFASITGADIAGLIAWLREGRIKRRGRMQPLAPRSINAHLDLLRAVSNQARGP